MDTQINPIPGLFGHSMECFDNTVYLYGGMQAGLVQLHKLYWFDLVTQSWSEIIRDTSTVTTAGFPILSSIQQLDAHRLFVVGGDAMYGVVPLPQLSFLEAGADLGRNLA